MNSDPHVRGALVGWRRSDSDHGAVLRLQVARGSAEYRRNDLENVEIALNDRQLRSLARDLVRATNARHIPLFARVTMWGRLRGALWGS